MLGQDERPAGRGPCGSRFGIVKIFLKFQLQLVGIRDPARGVGARSCSTVSRKLDV